MLISGSSGSARADRDGDVLAVVSQSGPTVSFFDAADDTLLGTLDVPAEPHELLWDPVRSVLWCSLAYTGGYYHANAGRRTDILAIDPYARRVLEVVDLFPEHAPHGLALDVRRGLLFVSVEGDGHGAEGSGRTGGVVVVDAATREVTGRIDTGAPGPHWFAADAAGRIGVAANKEAPYVSIVDLHTGAMTGKVEVPGSEGLAVSPDGARAYVAGPYASFGAADAGKDAAQAPNGVRVIDLAAETVIDVLPTAGTVLPVHLTAGGKLLAGHTRMSREPGSDIGRHEPGTLTVFDTGTGAEIGSVEVGVCPLTITSSPDGRLGYVASVVSSTVEIVDLESLQVLNTLSIPRQGEPGAHGLAYIPRTD
ncbi:MAG: YncE family protein [Catenulispora sp.]|nr:YncE family protein [Catenulispora sp.]